MPWPRLKTYGFGASDVENRLHPSLHSIPACEQQQRIEIALHRQPRLHFGHQIQRRRRVAAERIHACFLPHTARYCGELPRGKADDRNVGMSRLHLLHDFRRRLDRQRPRNRYRREPRPSCRRSATHGRRPSPGRSDRRWKLRRAGRESRRRFSARDRPEASRAL